MGVVLEFAGIETAVVDAPPVAGGVDVVCPNKGVWDSLTPELRLGVAIELDELD